MVLQKDLCVEVALNLVMIARENGYLLSTDIIQNGRHMVVSTILENREIWFYDFVTKSAWLAHRSS